MNIFVMEKKIKLLNALSDETRIKILQYMLNRELCACSIYPLVQKAQSTVSKHLKILEEAGIVEYRRDGINIWYKIKSNDAIQILKILKISELEVDIIKCNQKNK